MTNSSSPAEVTRRARHARPSHAFQAGHPPRRTAGSAADTRGPRRPSRTHADRSRISDGPNPIQKAPVAVFDDRHDAGLRKPVALESANTRPIHPGEVMFSRHPERARTVFEDGVDRRLRQALLEAVARDRAAIVDRQDRRPRNRSRPDRCDRRARCTPCVASMTSLRFSMTPFVPAKQASLLIAQPQRAVALRGHRRESDSRSTPSPASFSSGNEPLSDQPRHAERRRRPQRASACLRAVRSRFGPADRPAR